MNIHISNLSFSVTEQGLRDLFSTYGNLTSVKLMTDRETGRSRGFGFVEITDNALGQQAIQDLDQSTLEGRPLRVSEARAKEVTPFVEANPFVDANGGFKKGTWY